MENAIQLTPFVGAPKGSRLERHDLPLSAITFGNEFQVTF